MKNLLNKSTAFKIFSSALVAMSVLFSASVLQSDNDVNMSKSFSTADSIEVVYIDQYKDYLAYTPEAYA